MKRWLSRKKSSGCSQPLILTSASRSSSRLPMTACSASTLLGGSRSSVAGAIATAAIPSSAAAGEGKGEGSLGWSVGRPLGFFGYRHLQFGRQPMPDVDRHLVIAQALNRLRQIHVMAVQRDLVLFLQLGHDFLA